MTRTAKGKSKSKGIAGPSSATSPAGIGTTGTTSSQKKNQKTTPVKVNKKTKAKKAVKVKQKVKKSLPNNSNQNTNTKRRGAGDQSYNNNSSSSTSSNFGPLRFPEQVKRKTAGHGLSKKKKSSSSSYKSNFATSHVSSVSSFRRNNDESNGLAMSQQQQQQQQQQRKRDKFELRMPSSTQERRVLYKEIAWYETFDQYSDHGGGAPATMSITDCKRRNGKSPCEQQEPYCLPTDFLSSDSMHQLSRELHAFAGYVRLQPLEHEARQFMIQSLANLAGATFAGRRQQQQQQGQDDVHLQVFGSYATPEVCTFSSDVDMALWGVVPAPQLTNLVHQEEEEMSHEDDGEESNVEHRDDQQRQQYHRDPLVVAHRVADAKEQKVQKWRDLLQELADKHQKQEEEDEKEREEGLLRQDTAPKLDVVKNPRKKTVDRLNEEVEVPFFVLDTLGDVEDGEGDEHKSAVVKQTSVEIIDLVDSEDEKETEAALVSDSTRDDGVIDLVDLEKEMGLEPYASNDQDSDSDGDSADKLESMLHKRRRRDANGANGDTVTSLVGTDQRASKRQRTNIQNDDSETGFEVSFHSQVSPKSAIAPPAVVGPVGATRTLVIRALQLLKNGLHKNRMFSTIGIRRFARVPIVTMESRLGFEGDVAIGGHNGTDTSQFAATLVKRYKSFATVVLFLKILLNQQGLDKPFTGGLGSYKLYVMVCHHLERHLSLGGNDEPGEVLASFFYRFGRHSSATKSTKVSHHCTSTLTKDSEIECRDGLADLKPCHNLTHCVELFSICWQRLSRRLSSKDIGCSFLVELIRPTSIQTQRQDALQRASNLNKYRDERTASSSSSSLFSYSSSRPTTAKRGPSMSVGQKIAHIFSKRPSNTNPNRSTTPQHRQSVPNAKTTTTTTTVPPKAADPGIVKVDASEEELLRGYGVRRSINGTLIPRSRPDVEQGITNHSLAELFGRVSKNRKNKKKQSRDRNLQAIAREV